jgi:MFS family permease
VYKRQLQGFTLIAFVFATTYVQFAALAVMLGIGTALVYPTFLTAISMYSHPMDRAKSLGVFRLWRDLGYSIGALLTGVLICYFDYTISILVIALLTIFSAAIVWKRMFCRELFI